MKAVHSGEGNKEDDASKTLIHKPTSMNPTTVNSQHDHQTLKTDEHYKTRNSKDDETTDTLFFSLYGSAWSNIENSFMS